MFAAIPKMVAILSLITYIIIRTYHVVYTSVKEKIVGYRQVLSVYLLLPGTTGSPHGIVVPDEQVSVSIIY